MAGDHDKPRTPTPPSAAPEPTYLAAAALPAAIAVPTDNPHEEGGDSRRAVGSRSTEPPTYLQFQNGIAAPIHLDYGGAAEKYRARATVEAACRSTADSLRFRPPRTTNAITFMLMALTFHTEDPDGVGKALNIFLFPDLYPSAGSEVALLTRKWDAILGGGTLTSFADTILLMGKQKVSPIARWDEAVSQLEAWAVSCTVFLGDDRFHPATYEMFLLLEETSGVSQRLRAQARQKSTFPSALLRLIQQEFNKSFYQALDRWQRVRWMNLESLRRALATGNFRPDLVALPGGLAPPERPLSPPAAPRCQASATPQPTADINPTPQ